LVQFVAARDAYEAEFEGWDAFVSEVLGWLGRP